jgi:mitochondrial FAD-linked sulfhydryl oxidase
MSWTQHNTEDCDGCEMMSALSKMNQKLKAKKSTPNQENEGNEKKDENENKDEKPLDLNELGNATWGLLHTMAAYYPSNPSPERQAQTKKFLEILGDIFPCQVCGDDWKDVINRSPPIVSSQPDFSNWLCEAHNDINVRLGKPEFPCHQANARWRANFFDDDEK